MELVLAMDLRRNMVVHGKRGHRATYKPLDWGCSPTSEPLGFVEAIAPKYLYIADIDRIERTGSHDEVVQDCARRVSRCYLDRGAKGPEDILDGDNIVNIFGTETCGSDLSHYHGGFLSIDVKDGCVIPSAGDPLDLLRSARQWDFDGCIILNLGAVGTESGIDPPLLRKMRSAYDGRLFYGGGVAGTGDLETIERTGFDGVIIATALHRGAIPLAWIRRGSWC